VQQPRNARALAAAYGHPGARMSGELCTVDIVADRLKLHPKTVLRFIRDGKLRAARVGKSYRILRADLEAFAGVPVSVDPSPDEAWVTSIVDVPGVDPALAKKWASVIPGALNARQGNGASMRAEVIYEAERAHLKIVAVGAPSDTANLLSLVQVWLQQLKA